MSLVHYLLIGTFFSVAIIIALFLTGRTKYRPKEEPPSKYTEFRDKIVDAEIQNKSEKANALNEGENLYFESEGESNSKGNGEPSIVRTVIAFVILVILVSNVAIPTVRGVNTSTWDTASQNVWNSNTIALGVVVLAAAFGIASIFRGV
jgi:hypothetical protein